MPAIELTLPQLTAQDPDGTINFNASGISTIAASPSSFMIFYLAQEDEQNGYGTVIQLDEQHQASIYPDLNPEYTYLFYKDEQGQLQTLLWCIEFATRNADGLYITQAKVHGRGVTEADMQRFNQIMVTPASAAAPASPHNLAETYTPNPAPQSVAPTPAPAQMPSAPAIQPNPQPILSPMPSVAPEAPTPAVASVTSNSPAAVSAEPILQPLPQPEVAPTPAPAPPPAAAPLPTLVAQPITFPALPDLPTAAQPTPTPAEDFMPEFDLPPLPPLTAQTPPVSQSVSAPPQPLAEAANQNQIKNPVGRPPKPLLSETTWQVDQNDFAWAKAISRDPIATNQQELRQKIHNQIQRNQPELLNNPAFQPALDQAFTAICQTYDLAPTARQDLLKSLLNGRIVENLVKTLH